MFSVESRETKHNVEGSQEEYLEWKKSFKKEYLLWVSKYKSFIERKVSCYLGGSVSRDRGMIPKGQRRLVGWGMDSLA